MDSLIFLPDTVKTASGSGGSHQASDSQAKKDTSVEEPEAEVEAENLERPVDLYKVKRASFSGNVSITNSESFKT